MKPTALALALLAALTLSACAGAKPAPGCQLEFLFAEPKRPFERLAEYDEMVRVIPPGGAHEALRSRACAAGADAVVITKSLVVNLLDHTTVQGYAIKWSPAPAPAPAEPAPAAPAPAPVTPTPKPDPETLKL